MNKHQYYRQSEFQFHLKTHNCGYMISYLKLIPIKFLVYNADFSNSGYIKSGNRIVWSWFALIIIDYNIFTIVYTPSHILIRFYHHAINHIQYELCFFPGYLSNTISVLFSCSSWNTFHIKSHLFSIIL